MATFIGEKWKLPYTAQQLEGVVTNQVPRINAAGNWEVWDISTSTWVDTGIGAQGDGVTSFNGRQGAIVPQFADYASFYTPIIGKGINLLDNWYFPNPVNQRGLTTYTSTGYGIDRWVVNGITLSGGDIEATAAGSFMLQRLDNTLKSELAGKTITFSALTSVGLVSGSAVYQETAAGNIVFFADTDIQLYIDTVGEIAIYFITTAKKPIAVKLELGSVQTLAHNIGTDANPNWVLNDPPPNFAEELAKCQRYQFVDRIDNSGSPRAFGYGYDATTLPLKFITPVPLRTTPSVTADATLSITSGSVAINNAAAYIMSDGVYVVGTASGLTPGNSYVAWGSATIIFDANL